MNKNLELRNTQNIQNSKTLTTGNNNVNKVNNVNNVNKLNNKVSVSKQSSNSYVSNASNYIRGNSGSNTFGIVLLVVVILLILYSTYWAYNTYSSKKFESVITVDVMKDIKDATSKFAIGSGSIPSSKYSNEYSICMWLNIHDYTYNYGKEKVILRRGDADKPNIEIVLGETSNDLIVRLKLQSAAGSVSNFQDVSVSVMSQNGAAHNDVKLDTNITHGNTNDNTDLQNTTTNLLSCDNTIFDKISGNTIKYPTIKYNVDNSMSGFGFDSGSGSIGVLHDSATGSGETSNTILNTSQLLHDNITNTNTNTNTNTEYANDETYTLSHSDTTKISNNSAPVESQSIHNEYFNLVSGNEVQSCPRRVIENFDNTDNLVNAVSNVLLDICNISKYLQKQDTADTSIENINMMFNVILDILEKFKTQTNANSATNSATSRTSATSDTSANAKFEIKNYDNIINTLKDSITKLTSNNETMVSEVNELINKLLQDVETLNTLSSNTNTSSSNINLNTLQSAINSKLTESNCSLLINGTTQQDISINLFENLINLIKKSLYTYINNLSNNIQKDYPELSNSSPNINCVIDTSNSNSDPSIGSCIYKMIPLQKWVHVIVSVYNQVIDIYIDGQLGSSCVLKGYPAVSNLDVNLTPDGGFSGQISRVSFSNTAMTVTKSQDLYYAGPIISESIFTMIPSWVYYLIILIIVVAIIYSLFM